jgi:hypothetical protein
VGTKDRRDYRGPHDYYGLVAVVETSRAAPMAGVTSRSRHNVTTASVRQDRSLLIPPPGGGRWVLQFLLSLSLL